MCLINIESSFIVITVKDFTNSSVQGSSLFYRETPFGAILLNRAALLNHNIKAVNKVAELHKGDESVSLEAIGSTQDVIKLEVYLKEVVNLGNILLDFFDFAQDVVNSV